jgi:tetratricopeptide (TPR) repeat protein
LSAAASNAAAAGADDPVFGRTTFLPSQLLSAPLTAGGKFADLGETLAAIEGARKVPTAAEYENYWNQALAHFQANRLDQAMVCFRRLKDIDPKQVRGPLGEGVVYAQRGEFSRAAGAFDAALQIDPEFVPTYIHRANVHVAMGDELAAMNDYEEILKREPDNVGILLRRLGAHFQRRNAPAMMTDAEAVIKYQPKMPDGYIFRAIAHLLKGEARAARHDFDEAVKNGLPAETELRLRQWFYPATSP